jgi:hypothetical protein
MGVEMFSLKKIQDLDESAEALNRPGIPNPALRCLVRAGNASAF